jgi:opacity protein-like surface antigen
MDTRKSGVVATVLLVVSSFAAFAADMPVYKAPPPPAFYDWSGIYIGGHIGGGRGRSYVYDPYGTAVFGDFLPTPGPIAGAQAGVNHQIGSFVFGAEADLSFADMDGTNTCFDVSGLFYSANCRAHTHLFGTVTGRLGWAIGPAGRTLLYGKGGAAWMREQVDMLVSVSPAGANFASSTAYGQWGWTAGAGVEHALTAHWSVSIEYDYLQFGRHDVATPVSAISSSLCTPPPSVCFVAPIGQTNGQAAGLSKNVQLMKLGLSYRFGPDPTAPPPPGAGGLFLKARPADYVPDWAVEVGARYWYGRGRFEKNLGAGQDNPNAPNTLESRLTYDDMKTNSGEVFGRVDTPLNVFVKGNIGHGFSSSGHLNDEDWLAFPGGGVVPYSNTVSDVHSHINFGTGDVGVSFVNGADYRIGAFVGYNYLRQHMEASGCVQIASTSPAAVCIPPFPVTVLGIIEDSQWRSLRLGATADVMLAPRVKLNGDVAYLPYVRYDALDTHVLGAFGPRIFPASGHGTGIQLEAVLSYLVTDQFTIGVGGRYWAMWTTDAQRYCIDCSAAGSVSPPTSFRAATEQVGIFLQAGYKFDGTLFAKN